MDLLTVDMIVWGLLPMLLVAAGGALLYEWRRELLALARRLLYRYVAFRRAGSDLSSSAADFGAISTPESNVETDENSIAMPEIESEILFRQGEARAVAKLLHSGLCQRTQAIRAVSGARSGDGYSSFKRLVDASLLELQQQSYRDLDDHRVVQGD